MQGGKKKKKDNNEKNDEDKDDEKIMEEEEQRDPALILEVELQGLFARLIQSESQRRYRLMQIELDEAVDIIVGLKIGAREIGCQRS